MYSALITSADVEIAQRAIKRGRFNEYFDMRDYGIPDATRMDLLVSLTTEQGATPAQLVMFLEPEAFTADELAEAGIEPY